MKAEECAGSETFVLTALCLRRRRERQGGANAAMEEVRSD